MGIRRFVADRDNTITNAFKAGNRTRGTQSNMGASDIIEVFSIYAQASTSSLEQTRIIIDFPVSEIEQARAAGQIQQSGSVVFKLKMFNAEHSQTTPSDFSISIHALSSPWSEGSGLDMENYSDTGASNWISASVGTAWATEGGDYLENSYNKTVSFKTGVENLEVDISNIVEAWIAGTIDRNGLLLKLSGAAEDGSSKTSYYTKRFFGRNSEFILKRPVIEAQQASVITDDRSCLFKSSSLAPSKDNLNHIYFYNKIGSTLVDIPSTGSGLVVQLVSETGSAPESISGPNVSENTITASKISNGVYEAKFSYEGSSESLNDIWQIKDDAGELTQIHTGSSMQVLTRSYSESNSSPKFITNITNLKESYLSDEVETFRVFTKKKNQTPNIYTKSTGKSKIDNIKEMFYKVVRVSDNYEIVGYSTSSSVPYSKLSYDSNGSYFDLDMSILQPNYLYEVSFLIKESSNFIEQPEKFRFRVK